VNISSVVESLPCITYKWNYGKMQNIVIDDNDEMMVINGVDDEDYDDDDW
jgi:hypothetical protein